MRRRQQPAGMLRGHGNRPHRLFLRDVLRSSQRLGHGLNLPVRIGRTEEKVAAAHGANGEDRLLWADRTSCRLRSRWWLRDNCPARGRDVGTQRAEEVDWQ